MYKKAVIIKNASGLHARPASMFVKEASKYKCELSISNKDKEYNAKSIMGILSMGATKGDTITIMGNGTDEKEAVDALVNLVENEFDEA